VRLRDMSSGEEQAVGHEALIERVSPAR